MLRNFKLPKRFQTIHHPGRRVEIWMNRIKVKNVKDFSFEEQVFLKQFIANLEETGWIVLV